MVVLAQAHVFLQVGILQREVLVLVEMVVYPLASMEAVVVLWV